MTNKRIFVPGDVCRCGNTYDRHELREGFGLRKNRPQMLHCPGDASWSTVTPTGGTKRQYYFARAVSRTLPGGGPWTILENCLSTTHNTRRAAEVNGCTCPRSKDLLKGTLSRRNSARKALSGFILKPEEHTVRVPDFSGAPCTLPENRPIVDGGFSTEGTYAAAQAREAAKQLCRSCPLRINVCLPYVRAAESPPGSWGGVWAGLDPWERQGRKAILGLDGVARVVDA